MTAIDDFLVREKLHKERSYKRAAKLDAEKFALIGRAKIKCMHCGVSSALKSWTLQESQFYNPNTGSPNGGYYEYGSPEYDYLVCGQCGARNYIYNHPGKRRILQLRKLAGNILVFKAVTEYRH